ncbi:FAD-binding oxidoreductase [Paenibacillus sp. SYP-B3998]|uniref:FAD-binding oxidoreductase n=1 Tax=Paenibacillus sp. SYP-B3998 TaxID=2678564 RepID=A0A6G3ZVR1_9BACL|nr:FAD-binding oxidoreductase [Paenibacillus sp. SYP-B3998]NEW05661.1 FAD-binding oxidoreductase [Paenibacillus sp. SYP-B3998]
MENISKFKILFSYPIRQPHLMSQVDYDLWENLYTLSNDMLVEVIFNLNPDAIVAQNYLLLQRIQELQIRSLLNESIILVYATNPESASFLKGVDDFHLVACEDTDLLEVKVLQHLEEQHNRMFSITPPKPISKDAPIAIIGAGIVNLITAFCLVQKGYKLVVYAADPTPYEEDRWKEYGCTLSGNDARIFSFNESRQHHYYGDPLLAAPIDQYRKSVPDNGWLCCPKEQLSTSDWKWIEEYESYPQWMYQKIQKEIIDFNKESYDLWNHLSKQHPELLEDTGYVNRLFRVYSTPEQYKKGIKAEQALGSFIRELNTMEIERLLPSLHEALRADAICGVIEVEGFGIHIHKLALKLIKVLEEKGTKFHWNESFDRIEFDRSGQVKAIRTGQRTIVADYFVVSPGVPRNDFLKGTSSHGKIGAMLGCWLTLPTDNVSELLYPIKVTRAGYASEEAASGANIIPGIDRQGNQVIHISSGHGFLGLDPHNLHADYIRDLSRAVHETAEDLFPSLYKKAQDSGMFNTSPRYCIRPWTPSCLGVFEGIPTVNNGLFIITGGHNTGGFAHSMSVANAVIQAFEGSSHPMHRLYHPDRLKSFFTPYGLPHHFSGSTTVLGSV